MATETSKTYGLIVGLVVVALVLWFLGNRNGTQSGTTGSEIKQEVREAGHEIKDGAQEAGDEVKEFGQEVKQSLKDVTR
jgi:hypothetical protein